MRFARFQPPPVFQVPPGFLTSQRAVPDRTPSRDAYTQPTPRKLEPRLYQTWATAPGLHPGCGPSQALSRFST
ncbi:hypothetical protein ACIRQO_36515 [Streptomyces anulatus]